MLPALRPASHEAATAMTSAPGRPSNLSSATSGIGTSTVPKAALPEKTDAVKDALMAAGQSMLRAARGDGAFTREQAEQLITTIQSSLPLLPQSTMPAQTASAAVPLFSNPSADLRIQRHLNNPPSEKRKRPLLRVRPWFCISSTGMPSSTAMLRRRPARPVRPMKPTFRALISDEEPDRKRRKLNDGDEQPNSDTCPSVVASLATTSTGSSSEKAKQPLFISAAPQKSLLQGATPFSAQSGVDNDTGTDAMTAVGNVTTYAASPKALGQVPPKVASSTTLAPLSASIPLMRPTNNETKVEEVAIVIDSDDEDDEEGLAHDGSSVEDENELDSEDYEQLYNFENDEDVEEIHDENEADRRFGSRRRPQTSSHHGACRRGIGIIDESETEEDDSDNHVEQTRPDPPQVNYREDSDGVVLLDNDDDEVEDLELARPSASHNGPPVVKSSSNTLSSAIGKSPDIDEGLYAPIPSRSAADIIKRSMAEAQAFQLSQPPTVKPSIPTSSPPQVNPYEQPPPSCSQPSPTTVPTNKVEVIVQKAKEEVEEAMHVKSPTTSPTKNIFSTTTAPALSLEDLIRELTSNPSLLASFKFDIPVESFNTDIYTDLHTLPEFDLSSSPNVKIIAPKMWEGDVGHRANEAADESTRALWLNMANNGWLCTACDVRNSDMMATKCISCETPREGAVAEQAKKAPSMPTPTTLSFGSSSIVSLDKGSGIASDGQGWKPSPLSSVFCSTSSSCVAQSQDEMKGLSMPTAPASFIFAGCVVNSNSIEKTVDTASNGNGSSDTHEPPKSAFGDTGGFKVTSPQPSVTLSTDSENRATFDSDKPPSLTTSSAPMLRSLGPAINPFMQAALLASSGDVSVSPPSASGGPQCPSSGSSISFGATSPPSIKSTSFPFLQQKRDGE
ncbi:hypothetical protein SeMB42_g02929 [Synchytrium endobioticum]|uniref:RanBP2-type domain-containing protein n=1 Tax=Synchytrium endobioticum TaxID=286115 RepID=A0A507DAB2_9FUNG|nr:hypothetical protein SeMB42_g02929 [Synchytrium endobioticum]